MTAHRSWEAAVRVCNHYDPIGLVLDNENRRLERHPAELCDHSFSQYIFGYEVKVDTVFYISFL